MDVENIAERDIYNMVAESVKRILAENNIDERGGSSILYHFTDMNGLMGILTTGKLGSKNPPNKTDRGIGRRERQKGINIDKMSVPELINFLGLPPESGTDNIEALRANARFQVRYPYYISFTRMQSSQWGYPRAMSPSAFHKTFSDKDFNVSEIEPVSSLADGLDKVRITVDGRAMSAGHLIRPIDFFVSRDTKIVSDKWAGRKDDIKRQAILQQEDRLFLDKPFFDVSKFVTRIDVLINFNNKTQKEKAVEFFNIAKQSNLGFEDKIHIYGDRKSFDAPKTERFATFVKERTDDILALQNSQVKNKNEDESTRALWSLYAKAIWCILFYRNIEKTFVLRENYLLGGEALPRFKYADVYKEIQRILGEYPKVLRDKYAAYISQAYNELRDSDILKFCYKSNPKISSSSKGIYRLLSINLVDDLLKAFRYAMRKLKIVDDNDQTEKTPIIFLRKLIYQYFPGARERIMQYVQDVEYKEKAAKAAEKERRNAEKAAKMGRGRRAQKMAEPSSPIMSYATSLFPKLDTNVSTNTNSSTLHNSHRRGRMPSHTEEFPLIVRGLGEIGKVKSPKEAEELLKKYYPNITASAAYQRYNNAWNRYSKGYIDEGINLDSNERGWCIILVGGPGSGKSYFIKNNLPIKGEVFDIDNYRQKYLEHIKDNAEDYKRLSKRGGFKELQQLTIPYLQNCEKEFLETHSSNESNVIFDIGGRRNEDITSIIDLVKPYGYKIGLCWVACNRSVAMQRNIERGNDKNSGRIVIPDKPFHTRTNGVNKNVPLFLTSDLSNDISRAWIIFTSSSSLSPMSDEENNESVIELNKTANGFEYPDEVSSRVNNVLGPKEKSNNFQPITYLSQAEIKKGMGNGNDFLRPSNISLNSEDLEEMISESVKSILRKIL